MNRELLELEIGVRHGAKVTLRGFEAELLS